MLDTYAEVMRELLCAAILHRVTEMTAVHTVSENNGLLVRYHIRPGLVNHESMKEAKQAFCNIIGEAIDLQHDTLTKVSTDDDPDLPQFCFVLLSPERPKPLAAAAFILRCRDVEHAQAALASLRAETPMFCSGRPLE